MRQLHFELPRDTWTEFLSAVQFGEYDVIEVRRPVEDLETFAEIRTQLDLARTRIARGEYNAAVSATRTALERVIQEVRDGGPSLKELFAARTDIERGEIYGGIITHLKSVCNRAVHKPEASLEFSRAEAVFVVRTAESGIALLGQLLRP